MLYRKHLLHADYEDYEDYDDSGGPEWMQVESDVNLHPFWEARVFKPFKGGALAP